MKQKLKKGVQQTINAKYRVTFFTLFILIVYGVGFWHFNRPQEIALIEGLQTSNQTKIQLEEKIQTMTKGYPIEKMTPYIIEKDNQVAAFLVSIAKKESNWGKRVPVLNGEDCFNYWGYRGGGTTTKGGYTCFESREEAIDIVGGRISELINKSNLQTPRDMIIWKCGSSCAGHSDFGVRKWISDVAYYFEKVYDEDK
jgi:hypothetical protein